MFHQTRQSLLFTTSTLLISLLITHPIMVTAQSSTSTSGSVSGTNTVYEVSTNSAGMTITSTLTGASAVSSLYSSIDGSDTSTLLPTGTRRGNTDGTSAASAANGPVVSVSGAGASSSSSHAAAPTGLSPVMQYNFVAAALALGAGGVGAFAAFL